jgi:hypothetical protein
MRHATVDLGSKVNDIVVARSAAREKSEQGAAGDRGPQRFGEGRQWDVTSKIRQ